MTCREFIDFIQEYLEGSLPPAERESFLEHLALCPSCVAYLETYQQTILLAKDAFRDLDATVPDEVPEALVSAILAATAKEGA
ncbi:MAG TPA: zf-HC2 domain-containing protein [Vicinamibacteria bacterium]|nr:zf-HC2 domain-containing protein [Vicinamibacteria bacterium]